MTISAPSLPDLHWLTARARDGIELCAGLARHQDYTELLLPDPANLDTHAGTA